jgi:hypothetical protein
LSTWRRRLRDAHVGTKRIEEERRRKGDCTECIFLFFFSFFFHETKKVQNVFFKVWNLLFAARTIIIHHKKQISLFLQILRKMTAEMDVSSISTAPPSPFQV